MIAIAFKQTNQTQQISIPPIFMELNQNTLNFEVKTLIDRVYQEFKNYLSPFVTSQHLRLQLPNHEILFRKTPLFLYLNYGQFLQTIFCNISSIEKIRQENLAIDNYRHTMIMRIRHREEEEKCKDQLIFKKHKTCEELNFKDFLHPEDQFIVGGRSIVINTQDIQETWLTKNWKKYENKANHCLYVCIDRQKHTQ